MLLLNNGLCFVMRLVTKLDAVHLSDTIVQKRKQSKHGTGEQVNRMDDMISRQAAIDAIKDNDLWEPKEGGNHDEN